MLKDHSISNIPHFWFLQLVFWAGLSLITFFTLTLWYGNYGWPHVAHTLLQGLLGVVLSLPLHMAFSRIWEVNLQLRFALSLLAVAIAAALWTVLRIITFIWITVEQDVWSDFGGWYFGAIFVFLCWSSLYHGIRYFYLLQTEQKKKEQAKVAANQEQLRRLQAEADTKDAQIKMLRYQINPHFLFNTLNAINSLIQVGQTDRAQRIIVQLSQFLRFSLDNNPDLKISLAREIDALNLYLEIEKTRFAERLELDFNISAESQWAMLPSLLLQPLIENSMKYAIAKSEHGGIIRLRSRLQDQQLIIELSDTGAGGKLESNKIGHSKGRGIGLRNTTDRLKAFYGEEYSFDLQTSSAGGLKTIITIPLELSPESNHATATGRKVADGTEK